MVRAWYNQAMKRVAFVTFADARSLNRSDALVVPLLAKKGVFVEGVPWDDPHIDWKVYDVVILRSCWNYHRSFAKFQKWLAKLDAQHVRVWNSISRTIWNTNKSYLFELEASGIAIVPSLLCVHLSMNTIFRARVWDTLIIKPVVGATARGIKKFSSAAVFLWVPYVLFLLRRGPVIIQEYMETVTHGEYSLVFFDKKFSHAVKKTPKIGDFRSQEAFGGEDVAIAVSNDIIKQAQYVLDRIDEKLLYARVDGLVVDGKFYLMELELAEPYLFLETNSLAPSRFAAVIYSCLNRIT